MCSKEKEEEETHEKEKQNVKNKKPASDKRKQQLVTCIQLATELEEIKKTDTKPNKRNVYSIKSAYPIEFGRRGGSELSFPVKFQKEMGAVKHEEDRRGCADTSAVQVSALHQYSALMYTLYIDF